MSPQDKCTLSFYRDLEPMGTSDKVILVRHIESGRIYVKKRLSAYSREMYRFLQGKDFAGVPHVYECLDDDDCIVVIEEYVPGETLRQYMDEQGPLPEPRAKQLIEALCEILERLHGAEKPIVCRDLKPSNVILTKDDKLVIVDFDAAKFVTQEKVDTILLGTPGYAAPEQFGFAASDERTDVYAVGVLLNEMLTGELPQEKLTEGKYGRVVRRSTSLDPKERHGSIADFRLDLNGRLRDRSNELQETVQSDRRFLPPGFRTRTWWKMIIAIGVYSFAIFAAIMYFIGVPNGEGNPIFDNISIGVFWLLLFFWTIAYAYDYLGIRKKMPASRIKNRVFRSLGHIAIWIIGCFISLLLVMPITLLSDIF